jgi:two-component system, response regulator, stage 0 sporulation protein F
MHKLHVLVADDDSDLRALLCSALVADGHDVTEAANGREALDALSPMLFGEPLLPPDVIVTDVRMPGISGLSLVAGLRSCGCMTPVIVMSAFDGESLRDEAWRAGADVVFQKPFELDDMRTAVINVVRQYFLERAPTMPDLKTLPP